MTGTTARLVAANYCASGVAPADKDGNPRWDIALVVNATGMSEVDIGAYEFQGGSADTK